jgi:hypothetical protein
MLDPMQAYFVDIGNPDTKNTGHLLSSFIKCDGSERASRCGGVLRDVTECPPLIQGP